MPDNRSRKPLPAVMDVGTFRVRSTCPDCGHARGWCLAKRVTGHHMKRFAVQAIAKGSELRTDGWGAYPRRGRGRL